MILSFLIFMFQLSVIALIVRQKETYMEERKMMNDKYVFHIKKGRRNICLM